MDKILLVLFFISLSIIDVFSRRHQGQTLIIGGGGGGGGKKG